jgi:hypothetical protein
MSDTTTVYDEYIGTINNQLGAWKVVLTPPSYELLYDNEETVASDGIVVSWDGDKDDPLKPFYGSGMTVTFLSVNNFIDVTGGALKDSYTAVLYKDNVEVWCGRVSPNTYSQPWHRWKKAISVECIDYLAQLKYVKFTSVNSNGLTTVRQYFAAALAAVEPSTGYLTLSMTEAFDVPFSRIAVMESNWYDESDEADTWEDVLSSIARTLKLRVIQRGRTVYVTDAEAAEDSGLTDMDALTMLQTPKLSLADTYDKIKVSVSTNNDTGALPNIWDDEDLTTYTHGATGYEAKGIWYTIPYLIVNNTKHVKTHYYTASNNILTERAQNYKDTNFYNLIGCWMFKAGSDKKTDTNFDTSTYYLVGGDPGLSNSLLFTWADNIIQDGQKVLVAPNTSTSLPTTPMLTISDDTLRVFPGINQLVLSAQIKFLEYSEPIYSHTGDPVAMPDKSDNTSDMYFLAKLRIGDKYYCYSSPTNATPSSNDTLWSKTETNFRVYWTPDDGIRNKTSYNRKNCTINGDMILRNGIDWKSGVAAVGTPIYIRSTDEVCGDIELTFYGVHEVQYRMCKGYAIVRNLSLDIYQPSSWADKETSNYGDNDIEYTNVIDTANVEEFNKITLYCHTDVKKGFTKSALILINEDGSYTYLSDVKNVRSGETAIVERHLVDALYNQLKTNRRVIDFTASGVILQPDAGFTSQYWHRRFLPISTAWHIDNPSTEITCIEGNKDY